MKKSEIEFEENLLNAYLLSNWKDVEVLSRELIKEKPEYPKGYIYNAVSLCMRREFNEAKDILISAEKLVKSYFVNNRINKLSLSQKNDYVLYNYAQGLVNSDQAKSYSALWNFNDAYTLEPNPQLAAKYKEKVEECYNVFLTRFFDLDHSKRKTIMIIEDLPKSRPSYIMPLLRDNLPEIEFPLGHPVKDVLYVGHPLEKYKYYPLLDYDKYLFDDKWEEFITLLTCLGATKINVEFRHETTVDEASKSEFELKSKGKISIHQVGFDIEQKASSSYSKQYFMTKMQTQLLDPVKKPHVPSNLLWFDRDKSWQTLAKQRLEGRILSHNMQYTTRETVMLSDTELLKVAAEYQNIIAGVEIEHSKVASITAVHKDELIWNINLEFKPIQDLNEKN